LFVELTEMIWHKFNCKNKVSYKRTVDVDVNWKCIRALEFL